MKMIKPIVNISKVIDNFDTVIIGFSGVLSDGGGVKVDAVNALINMKKIGKNIVLVSNSPLRVAALAKILHDNRVPLAVFDSMITAGEILHYRLKYRIGELSGIGSSFYILGDKSDLGVFAGLDFKPVDNLARADFLYMASAASPDDLMDKYLPDLQHAVSLNIPLLCVGNDTSTYKDGKVCLEPGAVAEQYAVLGGRILTLGKPDAKILAYALDGIEHVDLSRTLMIGDNVPTDIKGANLLGISAALVSKGVHVNYVGEGYIPDVAKTRELSTNFDAYPDFVISNLRW